MKKLLSILGSVVVLTGSTASIVSCGNGPTPDHHHKGPSDEQKQAVENKVTDLLQNFEISSLQSKNVSTIDDFAAFFKAAFESATPEKDSITKNNVNLIKLVTDQSAIAKIQGTIATWIDNYLGTINSKIAKEFQDIYNSFPANKIVTNAGDNQEVHMFNGVDLKNFGITRLGTNNLNSYKLMNPDFDKDGKAEVYYLTLSFQYTVNFPDTEQNSGLNTISLKCILSNEAKEFIKGDAVARKYTSYAATQYLASLNKTPSKKSAKDGEGLKQYNFALDPKAGVPENSVQDYVNKSLTGFELDPQHNGNNESLAFITGLKEFITDRAKNSEGKSDRDLYSLLDSTGKKTPVIDLPDHTSIFTEEEQAINMDTYKVYFVNDSKRNVISDYSKYYANNLDFNSKSIKGQNFQDFISNYLKGSSYDTSGKITSDLNSFTSKNSTDKIINLGAVGIDLNKIKLFGSQLNIEENYASVITTNPKDKDVESNLKVNINFEFNKHYYDETMKIFKTDIAAMFNAFYLSYDKNEGTVTFQLHDQNVMDQFEQKFNIAYSKYLHYYHYISLDNTNHLTISDTFGQAVFQKLYNFSPSSTQIDGIDVPKFDLSADVTNKSNSYFISNNNNLNNSFYSDVEDANSFNLLFRFTLGMDNLNGENNYSNYLNSSNWNFSYGYLYKLNKINLSGFTLRHSS